MVGKMLIPDKSGHSTVAYDTEQPETLTKAKELFDGVLAKGGAAFDMTTKEKITTWDPTSAEVLPSEVLLLQPLQGG